MANNENIEIRLIVRADIGAVPKIVNGLKDTDRQYAQTNETLKKVEQQARRTGDALRSIPRSSQPFAGLVSPPSGTTLTSPEALRAAERAAGLRTERSMAAEAAEAEIAAARRRRFLEDTQGRRAADAAAHESNALDGVTPTRAGIAGAIAATAATVGIAAKAFHELNEQQETSQRLAAAMETHGIASDDFFQHLHKVAQELSQSTSTKKAEWIEALSDLVSAGATQGNIDVLAKGVENLAGLMNGNIPGAALAMEKAMQGNFQTLQRWGIVVPEAATQAQKMETVLKSLAERGAGLMESRSKTLAGQWDNLKNSGLNLLAAFAGTFTHSELLKQSISGLASVFQKAAEWIGLPIPKLEALNTRLVTSSRVLLEAQESARKAAQEFNSIEHQADRAARAMERQATAAERIHRAQDDIASARRDLAIAQVDAAEHAGTISQSDAEIRRASIRVQFERGRFQRDQQATVDQQHAAEVRLNQLGTQRGLLESEAADVSTRLRHFQDAHAARSDLQNQEQIAAAAEARLAELRNRPTAAAVAASSGEVGGAVGPIQNPEEIARAEQFLEATRNRVSARRATLASLPNISDEEGAALQERMARLTTAMTDLSHVMEQQVPHLEDAIGEARLTRDRNAAVFGISQQTFGVQLQDQLSRTPGENIGAIRAALTDPNQEQLLSALRTAIILRNEAMTTGFTQLIDALNNDVRNLQAQIRSIANRRN